MLSVVPVKVMKPPGAMKLKNLDITGYPYFYLEHPTISILPTTHTKVNKNKAGYLVLLLSNTGNEVVVIEKSSTITLGIKSQWKVWSQKVWSKSKPPKKEHKVNRVEVNQLTTKSREEQKTPKASVQKVLENTAFVGRHNTYTKPKTTLRDVTLTPHLQSKFKGLKERYKDIFLVGPSDIGVTDLAEMTIETHEDALPYAARPYKLPLQHQDFLRREIQALLDAQIIVPSISQYVAPCMVIPRKCREPNPSNICEMVRLVINYKKLNKNLFPRECQ